MIKKNNRKAHHLLTTAFSPVPLNQELLSKTWRELKELCENQGLSYSHKTKEQLIVLLSSKNPPNNIQELDTETSNHNYTVETLSKLTVKQLKEICNQNKIKPKRLKKDPLIRLMVERLNPKNESLYLRTQSDLDSHIHNGFPVHHNFYKENFNTIDIHNRYWYQFQYKFQTKHWRTKMFFGLLGVAVVNSFTLWNEKERTDQLTYRECIIESLIEYDLDIEFDLNNALPEN